MLPLLSCSEDDMVAVLRLLDDPSSYFVAVVVVVVVGLLGFANVPFLCGVREEIIEWTIHAC